MKTELANYLNAEADKTKAAQRDELLEACKALLGIGNPPAGQASHIDYAVALRMAQKAIQKAEANG